MDPPLIIEQLISFVPLFYLRNSYHLSLSLQKNNTHNVTHSSLPETTTDHSVKTTFSLSVEMAEKRKTTSSKQTQPSKRDVVLFRSASPETETMTPKNEEMQLIIHEQKENYVTEFRNYVDDAWYTVSVTFEGNESLRVKYEEKTDEIDNLFEPGFFNSMEELQDFETRFRPISVQVQDHECRTIVPGVRVCASKEFGPHDLRFYDAHVVKVRRFLLFHFF